MRQQQVRVCVCTRKCVSACLDQSVLMCANNNSITVTIAATTNLYANVSTITLTNLNGAKAQTGPLQLMDKSGGQGHELMFAPSIGGAAGFGGWNNSTKTLMLEVVQDMDCSSEYLFSFTVTNQKVQQAQQDVKIGANKLHLYHPTSLIEASSMIHDLVAQPVSRGSAGDAAAMFIWEPSFTLKTVQQFSSAPCDLNRITVSLVSSVPLFAACSPTLTITGLTGSDTPSNPRQYWTEYS